MVCTLPRLISNKNLLRVFLQVAGDTSLSDITLGADVSLLLLSTETFLSMTPHL